MNWPEDVETHRENFRTVYRWIAEALGADAAHTWAWECTPYPCWTPSIEQLEEGVLIAMGAVRLGDVLERTYSEMQRLAKAAGPQSGEEQSK